MFVVIKQYRPGGYDWHRKRCCFGIRERGRKIRGRAKSGICQSAPAVNGWNESARDLVTAILNDEWPVVCDCFQQRSSRRLRLAFINAQIVIASSISVTTEMPISASLVFAEIVESICRAFLPWR